MSPSETGLILEQLGAIQARQEEHGKDLVEIKTEVKRTNGRVTAIENRETAVDATVAERKRADLVKAEQRQRWNGWFQPVITGVSTALIVAVLTLLVTGGV